MIRQSDLDDRRDRTLRAAAVVVFVVAVLAASLGIGVRATFGGHVAVDEPQYVLTALSLIEDGDLDISDELAQERWRVFYDRKLPVQTAVLADGSQVSPHDPLLPVLLAIPMGLGGWVAAKLTLALLAGALAALTLWVAVRRFGIEPRLAAVGVGIAAASAPLAVYGQQLYPELPAALATMVAVAALTGTRSRRNLLLLAIAVIALPWLSVKYAPVTGALAMLGAVRWWRAGRDPDGSQPTRHRRDVVAFGALLGLGGVAFLGVHKLVWGGWTAYATGDHFQQIGEFGVVGADPDYAGRSVRLVGLLVDRGYGIAGWQPAWLLVVPAVVAILARRRSGALTLAVPLAAGWLVASFVALTMHGHWWPGRQLVVVLPLALLIILCWLQDAGRRARIAAAGLGAVGVITYAGLLIDGYAREITWVSRFEQVDAPFYQLLRPILPDYRGDFWPLHLAWIAALIGVAALTWRAARSAAPTDRRIAATQTAAPARDPRTPAAAGHATPVPETETPLHPSQKGSPR